MNSNNKRIAKNTILLYFRMMFTMFVALYTSRVVLNILGVDDFGVYQTVGGVVGLLSFVNNALAVGSSRFLTYELGTGNFDKLKETFSTALSVHILLALILVVVAETIGLWYVYHKLVVSPERMDAAVFAYHISVLTSFITITQVPYNASIISHERMGIYAYVSIADVSLKLGVVYLLTFANYDRLKMYAFLLFLVQLCVAFFYRVYCIRSFKECHYSLILKKNIFKEVLSYSGWNLLSSTALALCNQGVVLLINAFFSPAAVAAKAIAGQVNMAANSFVNNFRTAVNPQIVKQYAADNREGSRKLLLDSTKFSFYLMLLLCIPIYLLAGVLLKLWLGSVPEYAESFLKIAILTSLIDVFSQSFYTGLYAKGQIRENAVISFCVLLIGFCLIFLLFKLGLSPISSAWVMFGCMSVISLIVKPFLLVKIVEYPVKSILAVYANCLKVTLLAVPIPFACYELFDKGMLNGYVCFVATIIISVISVCGVVWLVGLNPEMKNTVKHFVEKKIKRRL